MPDFEEQMRKFKQLRVDFYTLREEFKKSIQEFKKLNRERSLVNTTDIDAEEFSPNDEDSPSESK